MYACVNTENFKLSYEELLDANIWFYNEYNCDMFYSDGYNSKQNELVLPIWATG